MQFAFSGHNNSLKKKTGGPIYERIGGENVLMLCLFILAVPPVQLSAALDVPTSQLRQWSRRSEPKVSHCSTTIGVTQRLVPVANQALHQQ